MVPKPIRHILEICGRIHKTLSPLLIRLSNIIRRHVDWVLGCVFFSLIVCLLIVANTFRLKQRVQFEGVCDNLSIRTVGPELVGDKTRKKHNTKYRIPANQIIIYGTKLQFYSLDEIPNIVTRSIEPNSADHMAVFNFISPGVIWLTFQHDLLLDVLGPSRLDFTPEARETLRGLPTDYDIGFIFFKDSNANEMIWTVGESQSVGFSMDSFTMLRSHVFGYNFKPRTPGQIVPTGLPLRGYYFKRANWELDLPSILLSTKGYTLKFKDSKKNAWIDIFPKLLIKSSENRVNMEFDASMSILRETEGKLFLTNGAETEIGKGSYIEIPSGDILLTLKSTNETLNVNLTAITNSIKVNGEEQMLGWLSSVSRNYSASVNIITGLIGALLGGQVPFFL